MFEFLMTNTITCVDNTTNIFFPCSLGLAFNGAITRTKQGEDVLNRTMPHICDESYTRTNIGNW